MRINKKFLILPIALLLILSFFCFSVNTVHAFVPAITSTAQTETTITLSWSESNDLTFGSYTVTYSTSVNGPYITAGTITDKSQTSYAVIGLTPNTPYYFIVIDKYSPDLGITWDTSSSNTLQADTVAKPTISISAETSTTASLQWTDNNTYSTQASFVSYTIEMSTSGSNGPWTTVTTVTNPTQDTYMLTGLSTGLYYVSMYDTVSTASNITQTTATSSSAVISIIGVSISNTSPTTIYQGQSVQFTATASGGSANYTYQWYANGNVIPGAASSSVSFNPTAAGSYAITCTVKDATYNNSQPANSNSISVTSLQPTPAPTQQPTQTPTQQPTQAPTQVPTLKQQNNSTPTPTPSTPEFPSIVVVLTLFIAISIAVLALVRKRKINKS